LAISKYFFIIPEDKPLQPACKSPSVFETLLTKYIGRQSATFIEQTNSPPKFSIPS
tara:strand:+ start:28 stop:195 length:168 start_codon:yes stop_codon:yes gene_type:complete